MVPAHVVQSLPGFGRPSDTQVQQQIDNIVQLSSALMIPRREKIYCDWANGGGARLGGNRIEGPWQNVRNHGGMQRRPLKTGWRWCPPRCWLASELKEKFMLCLPRFGLRSPSICISTSEMVHPLVIETTFKPPPTAVAAQRSKSAPAPPPACTSSLLSQT
ncbi:hypothetical protein LZ554_006646 [Drepanopeziza brunnea f. sp. 'monogermtubi']|nr:hypothetical protein LZ554_006646 [Drepanopeziza brunnea f. sp. 'monogermtubi']